MFLGCLAEFADIHIIFACAHISPLRLSLRLFLLFVFSLFLDLVVHIFVLVYLYVSFALHT